VGPFLVGFFLALVANFVVTFVYVVSTFDSAPPSPEHRLGQSVVAWTVTLTGIFILYRLHPWAAYGAIGAYAALFLVLLVAGGATGPYACFAAYGYPPPYR
jgi:hypothetical protein